MCNKIRICHLSDTLKAAQKSQGKGAGEMVFKMMT